MLSGQKIKELAQKVGFDLCGVVAVGPLPEAEARFRRWLSTGAHASLGYLERNVEKRFDPRLLMEGCVTAVVCAVNYRSEIEAKSVRPAIASYALNRDYHLTIKEMLYTLLEHLRVSYPHLTIRGRAFTDSAPLAEKTLAVEAGLGWIGRQSLLVTPQYGTYIHLGELLLSEPCDGYDTPFSESRCGDCRACLLACPAGAISSERTIDARRCIACRTIEQGSCAEGTLSGWAFGCEECQSCCPHNRKTPLATHPLFRPVVDPRDFDRIRWLQMSEGEFSDLFGQTPLTRAGLRRIQEAAARCASVDFE